KQLLGSEVPLADWTQIADQLRERWRKAKADRERQVLGGTLYTLLNDRFRDTRLLPFLREQIQSAPDAWRAAYRLTLFEALLAQPWNNDHEQEAFALLKQLSSDTDVHLRLTTELPALHRLVDALLEGRRNQAERVWRDAGETDKLTRSEVQTKRAEYLRDARRGLAAALGDQAAQAKGPLADWLRMEQNWLLVQLQQETPQVLANCWKLLGDAPPKQNKDDDVVEQLTPAQAIAGWSARLLQQRAFVTVQYLAARRNAEPASIDKALKYIDAGIAHGKDNASVWRKAKFQFLLALDRPDDLERELRGWIREDVATAPWRVMLGYLLAERGDLKAAIPLLEAAEKDQLLTAADYRALADWYLVVDRREAYEQAQLAAFKQQPEYLLSNYLEAIRGRWYRTDLPLPTELDERTLLTFRALFEKSASPENYLSQLQALYVACRDFRLLQMLPDAVLGRTPNQIYPYLRQVDTVVLRQLRNEATADEIIARIKVLRQGERTPTDLRALDLLEALVERRSSELLDQPGPHATACLQALQRAFERTWSAGEPALMATFLAQFGKLPQPALVAEQLRELSVLHAQAEPRSRDHLQITSMYSDALFSHYDRREEAFQMMEAEVRDYLQANKGNWPPADNTELSRYLAMFEKLNRHAAGERILQARLAETKLPAQQRWYRDRLIELYQNALENGGEVSLGKDAVLLANTVKLINDYIAQADDENERYMFVTRMCNLLSIAQRREIASVNDLVRSFAFESIPRILPRQQQQYRNTAQAPQSVVLAVLGPKFALQYVVERMEQYPDRLETGWDGSWNGFGNDLGRLRHDAAAATPSFQELDARVLKLALRELRHDLQRGDNRNRNIYHHHYNYYWTEQQPEFARVANEVQAELKDSGRRLVEIAHYFWHGLKMHARAIEILLLAERDAILDESGRSQLVDYLQQDQRHAEAIPLLETLTRERPEILGYRLRLMRAYTHAQRPTQLRELLTQTDKLFHQEGRWVAESIGELATACGECGLYKEAVAYFHEAIALRQRDNAGVTRGDASLSQWYQHLAHAHSQLGQTKLAVDAACAAVVCWTERHHERAGVLASLQQVLLGAKDLDDFVRQLDADTAKSGEDSPLLRKALGQAYQARAQLPAAIAQYQLALALQPHDLEIHQALIHCFDATNQPREATRQLLALLEIERHNLPLYQQLAERYRDDEAEAERAATSIIEADANEAENHAAMAELRQKQERWGEAIPHWQRVAELRRLEPTGLLKLAAAQLHEKQWDAARQSIQSLQRTEWPARFANVAQETRQLADRLPK
ncbi:MAG TPA: hypothetical protein VL096_08025, partial [Pirellulaceae bacterium]|nr:hypothetical protein [Pirellulaceae bacterium]